MISSQSHTCSSSAEEVRRDEHGPIVRGDAADQVAHLADADRVEAVGGFVEDEQVGVAEQGRGDAEPLLHAQRVLAEPVVRPVGQADEVEHGRDAGRIVAAQPGQDA